MTHEIRSAALPINADIVTCEQCNQSFALYALWNGFLAAQVASMFCPYCGKRIS